MIRWILGHDGHPGNERTHELASEASQHRSRHGDPTWLTPFQRPRGAQEPPPTKTAGPASYNHTLAKLTHEGTHSLSLTLILTGEVKRIRGSGLLFQARAGTLGTRTWRANFTEDLETRCAICGSDSETIDHIVVACRGLTPHLETDSVPGALGFTMAVEVDEGLSHPAADRQKTKAAEGAIERTKRRLEDWWRKNRE
ncbi:hypothetical protein HPB47_018875 [Ixodes persulcatus]|uniref:Uncharacterized protein n=1 Tax=Ixodes persulcatus TaxID=34615 RepID=A0AC60QJP4_IXOPE|nr:hypothetical protein HPB47_018875 [Ixodes persulcatus]